MDQERQEAGTKESSAPCLQCDALSVRWLLSKIYQSSHSENCSAASLSLRCSGPLVHGIIVLVHQEAVLVRKRLRLVHFF